MGQLQLLRHQGCLVATRQVLLVIASGTTMYLPGLYQPKPCLITTIVLYHTTGGGIEFFILPGHHPCVSKSRLVDRTFSRYPTIHGKKEDGSFQVRQLIFPQLSCFFLTFCCFIFVSCLDFTLIISVIF